MLFTFTNIGDHDSNIKTWQSIHNGVNDGSYLCSNSNLSILRNLKTQTCLIISINNKWIRFCKTFCSTMFALLYTCKTFSICILFALLHTCVSVAKINQNFLIVIVLVTDLHSVIKPKTINLKKWRLVWILKNSQPSNAQSAPIAEFRRFNYHFSTVIKKKKDSMKIFKLFLFTGGEGALLASAGSVIGIGNDIGGSIRIPAFYNGIFGHKPSRGNIFETSPP